MKSKRAKAVDIPKRVKNAVWERDNHCCIICGNPQAMPNAHYIRRSQGGCGIEENVVTLCLKCHHDFDNGSPHDQVRIGKLVEAYLSNHYKGWCEEDLIYRKYDYGI